MHILVECLPALRYVQTLKNGRLKSYLNRCSPRILDCLQQIALNILFSHKNGMKIKKEKIKRLKRHKKDLIRLVHSTDINKKRQILKKGGLVLGLLTVMGSVIAALAASI